MNLNMNSVCVCVYGEWVKGVGSAKNGASLCLCLFICVECSRVSEGVNENGL